MRNPRYKNKTKHMVFIKLKSSCIAEGATNRIKGHSTEEKTGQSTFLKRLLFEIYKECKSTAKKKKTKNPV